MQKFMFRLMGLAILASTMLFTACEKDDPITPDPTSPNISFVDEAGFLSADAELFPNETFRVRLDAKKGTNDLQAISVQKNGMSLSTTLFEIDGLTANNPFIVDSGDSTYTITITNDGEIGQSNTYRFILQDKSQPVRTDDVSLIITTVEVPVTSTPLNVSYTAVVVNNADGPNQGGLNLDNGMTVPFNSAEAELRDRGIDLAQPNATNWRQEVEPRNGAMLRRPNAAMLENFNFASADSREILLAAWNTSTNLNLTKLNQGDLIMIRKGDDLYLIRATTINVTTNNNLDNYVFDVKGHRL